MIVIFLAKKPNKKQNLCRLKPRPPFPSLRALCLFLFLCLLWFSGPNPMLVKIFSNLMEQNKKDTKT